MTEDARDEAAEVRVPLELPWSEFKLEKDRQSSLVEKIVAGVATLIEAGHLRVGTKMPSIRQFARWYAISTFTVVEAYERLTCCCAP